MGYRQIAVTFFCFLGVLAFAGWRGTRNVYSSAEGATKALSLVNVDTGVVHIFGVVGNSIAHRTFRSALGPVKMLTTTHKVGYIDAAHTKHTAATAGDDQIVVMVFDSTRDGKGTGSCTKANSQGCSEVYIIESLDDGLTWTKPSLISRYSMSDIVHRSKPSVTYDREDNVIYIAYSHINAETGETKLGMVRKYLTEGKYRQEEILTIPGTYKKINAPKIAITIPEKKKAEIHLIFTAEIGEKDAFVELYTRSADKGKTWITPLDLTPDDHQAHHYKTMSSISIVGQQDLFILCSAKAGADMNLIVSKDGGKTWAKPIKVNNKSGLVPYIRTCGQTKAWGAIMVLFDDREKKTLEVVYYDQATSTIKSYPKPFADVPYLERVPMIDCNALVDSDVKLVIAGAYKSTIVFDDYNYVLPDQE